MLTRFLRRTIHSDRSATLRSLMQKRRRRDVRGITRVIPRFEALEGRRMLTGDGWLVTSSVVGSDPVTDLAQDTAGNTYVTGAFAGTMTIGSTTLTSNGVNRDLFVAKLDPSGNLLWANAFGGTGDDGGHGIDVGSDGSAYVTGSFGGTITLPTASGPINLTSLGYSDLLVFKLDTDGNGVWATSGGSPRTDYGFGVAVAGDGSVYVCGMFQETADFGDDTLVSAGEEELLAKIDGATGEFTWARQLGTPGTARDVLPEPGGDVFVVGNNVARFKDDGTLVWNLPGDANAGAFYQDPSTGEAFLYTDVSRTGSTVSSVALRESDANTGVVVWEKDVLEAQEVLVTGVATDAAGNLYVTGAWYDNRETDFDPGPGTFYLSNVRGGLDVFLLKLNSEGEFVSARRMGGADSGYVSGYDGDDIGLDIEVDSDGSIFVCGQWSGRSDFDLGGSTVVRNSPHDQGQGFVLKMTQGRGAISGRAFADVDGNGSQGTGEPPLVGATVYLDQNGNGAHDAGETSVTPDPRGGYTFSHLPAGTYTVRQVLRTGWASSVPSSESYTVTLADDQFVGGYDFGAYSPATTTTYTKNASLSIKDLKTVASTIVVSGGTSFIYDLDVRVNITHGNDADLDIFLIAPDGTRVMLSTDNGGSGDNFTNTIFDGEAAVSIWEGTAPFTGRYRPEGMEGDYNFRGPSTLNLLNGKSANGTWTLEIYDDNRGRSGTLVNWSLIVKGASTGNGLQSAEAVVKHVSTEKLVDALTLEQTEPLLAEAGSRLAAAGEATSNLANVIVQIADLPKGFLGIASGNTIYVDVNADGWGWFIDETPKNDSEFTTLGNQGEQHRMDLLTVLMHELEHVLGHDHDADGVMAETLAAGVRTTGLQHDAVALTDHVFEQSGDYRTEDWQGAWLTEQFEPANARARRRGY